MCCPGVDKSFGWDSSTNRGDISPSPLLGRRCLDIWAHKASWSRILYRLSGRTSPRCRRGGMVSGHGVVPGCKYSSHAAIYHATAGCLPFTPTFRRRYKTRHIYLTSDQESLPKPSQSPVHASTYPARSDDPPSNRAPCSLSSTTSRPP